MRRLFLAVGFSASLISSAFAADTSVPNMTAGSALSDTDLFYCAQSSGTTDRKCTGAQLKTYANTSAVDARTTTTEAIATSDQNKAVTFTNASAVAASIAVASSGTFFNGWATTLINEGAGTVTLTATTSTIDGAATLTLVTGQSVDLYSDGTNYFTARGRASSGSGTVTTSGSPASGNLAKFSGSTAITNGDLSGDCTTSGTLASTCNQFYSQHPYIASGWYLPPLTLNLATGAVFVASQIYCRYFNFPTTVTIGTVGVNVQTASSSGNVQIAYYSDGAGHLPGALLTSTASIATGTTGTKSGALGSSIQIGPSGTSTGRDVWECVNSDNATHVLGGFTNYAGTSMGAPSLSGLLSNAGNGSIDSISCNGANCNGGSSTFNTWPASLVGSTWTYNQTATRFPVTAFQVTSSP